MLPDIAVKYRACFAPGVSTELRIQKNITRRAAMRQGILTTNQRSDVQGVSARVYDRGVWGFSSASDISDEAVQTVLKEARRNAHVLSSKAKTQKPALPALLQGAFPAQPDFTDVKQAVYIQALKELDAFVQTNCPKLKSRTLVISSDAMEKQLVTSDGFSCHTLAPRSYVYLFFTGETKDGTPVEVFSPIGGRGAFDTQFATLDGVKQEVLALYEHLIKKQEGVYADAGLKTVILNGMMSGMLAHEAVGHTVEADLVKAGAISSQFLNKQVASPLVNMVDFAHTYDGKPVPLPIYVDDEGVKAEDVTLIENGILKDYMQNRELAMEMGMTPRGNARAWLFSDEPLVRMRNTAVLPGQSKLSDMIASIEDGYYLMNSTNGQADATGEFMFGVSIGYEIKNGRLGRALLDTTVSGVAFDMLKTVTMVGDTISWSSSGFCGKKQMIPVGMGGPDLKCQITIGGR